MGSRQCLPLSVVQLKGKHCRKPHYRNGVVDMFGKSPTVLCWQKKKRGLELHSIDNFETSFFTSKVIIWLWYSYMMRCIPVEIHNLCYPWYLFQNIPTFHYLKSIDLVEWTHMWDHNPTFHLGTAVCSLERKKLKAFCLLHILCFVAL